MKKTSSITSFAKNFALSLSVGFFIGLGVVTYFLGPRGVRQQVCQGYVENSKSLAESRAEKESYLESFMPRSGDILVEVAQNADEAVAPAAMAVPVAENAVVKPLTVNSGVVKPAVKHVAKKVSRYRKGYQAAGTAKAKPTGRAASKKSKGTTKEALVTPRRDGKRS